MGQRQNGRREDYMRQIDFIFYREQEIREAVFRAKRNSPLTSSFVVAREGKLSDPTAILAVSNLTPLRSVITNDGDEIQRPEQWLEVIDKTYNYCGKCDDCRLEVARRRYRREDYRITCTDGVGENLRGVEGSSVRID